MLRGTGEWGRSQALLGVELVHAGRLDRTSKRWPAGETIRFALIDMVWYKVSERRDYDAIEGGVRVTVVVRDDRYSSELVQMSSNGRVHVADRKPVQRTIECRKSR
jgi:hypothetical protein